MLGVMRAIDLPHGGDAAWSTPLSWRARASALLANRGTRNVLGVVALAVLYRGVAQIGYALQFAGPVAAVAWLPVGVGIAFLYLGGLRFWPGVLLGDLLANDYDALPLGSALGQTCGNVLEILVATVRCCGGSCRAAIHSKASAAWGACSSPSEWERQSARPWAPAPCCSGM